MNDIRRRGNECVGNEETWSVNQYSDVQYGERGGNDDGVRRRINSSGMMIMNVIINDSSSGGGINGVVVFPINGGRDRRYAR